MTQQQELRVILRTIAQNAGAEQVASSLGRVRDEARRSEGGLGGLGRGFDISRQSAIRFVGALTGAQIGLSIFASLGEAIRGGLEGASDAFVESARVARATAASYGINADQFTRFAAALSVQTGFTRNAILEAALSARTLSENYGLSIQQTQKLIAVSADLAQVRGIGVAEAFERIQSAVRGEAEASEFLGLTLNATFLQQHAANGAFRETFTTLSDAQRAQVVYNEILRQTAAFSGLAAQSAGGLEGAQRRAALAQQELSRSIGEMTAPAQIDLLKAQAGAFDSLADAIRKARAAQAGDTAPIAAPTREAAEEERAGREFIKSVQGAGPFLEVFRRGLEALGVVPAAARQIVAPMRQAEASVTVISRALQDIHDRAQQLTIVAQLPFVGMDETAKSADLSVTRLRQDMEELQRQSSDASNVLNALGTSAGTAGQRAALAAENDLRAVLNTASAMTIAAQSSLRAQEAIAAQVSDPRDAIGGSNRIAQQRLALLDQLEPAERALIEARREQNDLTRQGIQLAAQEAAQTLRILPQREHLQDVQDKLRLDQLNLQLRGTLSPEQRTATRREIRDINRRQLPEAERSALLADIGLRPVQRAEDRNRLLGQIAGGTVSSREQDLAGALDRAAAALTAASQAPKQPQQIIVSITDEGGTTRVVDQLIEANGQAQTPPVIQVSAVRR